MSDDGEEFYKKRVSWLQDMWDAEREELNACLKRSNEYFLEYCKERDALRAKNEKLREALKPFAEKYKINDDSLPNAHNALTLINVGDLRAAAAAIRESE